MQKIKISELFFWLFGILVLNIGISLIVKSNLGVTSLISLPYVFSLRFTFFSLGVWSYLSQGAVMLLL
jgi:uncharacterized membrane protein YczE